MPRARKLSSDFSVLQKKNNTRNFEEDNSKKEKRRRKSWTELSDIFKCLPRISELLFIMFMSNWESEPETMMFNRL